MKSVSLKLGCSSAFLIRFGLVIIFCSILPFFGVALVSCHSRQDTPEAELKKRQQIEASLTLLENAGKLIPLDRLDTLRIAALSVGEDSPTEFQYMLANYMKVDFFNLPEHFTTTDLTEIKSKLKNFNLIIAGVHSVPTNDFEPLLNYLL